MVRLSRVRSCIRIPVVLWHPSNRRHWGKHFVCLLLLELPLLFLIIPLLDLELQVSPVVFLPLPKDILGWVLLCWKIRLLLLRCLGLWSYWGELLLLRRILWIVIGGWRLEGALEGSLVWIGRGW